MTDTQWKLLGDFSIGIVSNQTVIKNAVKIIARFTLVTSNPTAMSATYHIDLDGIY